MQGVGNHAKRNLIHNAPHMGIYIKGNDHLIEFNEIHNVCYETIDMGAIYGYCNWTERGTVISHNFIHHITGFQVFHNISGPQAKGYRGRGIYLDQMLSGTKIDSNVFYKVTRAAFIGGGRDCIIANNIFVDCPEALHIDGRGIIMWAKRKEPNNNYNEEIKKLEKRLKAMPCDGPLWTQRYPKLAAMKKLSLEDQLKPEGNTVEGNIFLGVGWYHIYREAYVYDNRLKEENLKKDNLVAPDLILDFYHQRTYIIL